MPDSLSKKLADLMKPKEPGTKEADMTGKIGVMLSKDSKIKIDEVDIDSGIISFEYEGAYFILRVEKVT